MKDETLLKLSLIVSVTGIILLFVFAQTIEAEKIEIADIDKSFIGNNIEVFADIITFYSSDGNYFLKIRDKTGNISAIIFKQVVNSFDTSKLKKGQQIKLSGEVSDYKGSLEIITNKIDFI